MEPPPFKLQVANGDIEAPTKTILLQFEIGVWNFKETFIVFLRLTGPIIGLTFLKSNSAILDVSKRLSFSLISLTHSPLMITPETENYTESIPTLPIRYPHETTHTITVHTVVSSNVDTTGVINPAINHCSGHTLIVASSISTVVNRKLDIRVTNTAHTPYKIKKKTTVAEFKILSPEEAKEFKPLNTAALKVLTDND